jgi:hypothetical protein
MKEFDDGTKLIQEFWRQAISSQISVLDAMANAVDNLPQDMQGGCLREMYKTNARFMTLYFRALQDTGEVLAKMQTDALRRCTQALEGVLSNMDSADGRRGSEANNS